MDQRSPRDRSELVDVSSLHGLDEVGRHVTITNNTQPTNTAAQVLVSNIGTIGGTVTVSGNE